MAPNIIIDLVCARLAITTADMRSSLRAPRMFIARAIATRLLREFTVLGYESIADALGRPNHSTVITADQRLTERAALPRGDSDRTIYLHGGQVDVIDLLDELRETVRTRASSRQGDGVPMKIAHTIEIVVEGEPIGQPRQDGRVLFIPGKRPTVQMYTPKVREKIGEKPNGDPLYGPDKLEPWINRIKTAAYGKAPNGQPITGLVHLHINAFFSRREYHEGKRFPKAHPLAGLPIPQGAIPHHARPDKDNVEKAVADALVKAELLRDDAQICGGGTFKWYCAVGKGPGVRIKIEVLDLRAEDGQLSLLTGGRGVTLSTPPTATEYGLMGEVLYERLKWEPLVLDRWGSFYYAPSSATDGGFQLGYWIQVRRVGRFDLFADEELDVPPSSHRTLGQAINEADAWEKARRIGQRRSA